MAQGFVTSLSKDRNGMLWIGTGNGISTFDGSVFSTYRAGQNIIGKIPSNKIQQIFTDSDQDIWINTDGDFLCYRNRVLELVQTQSNPENKSSTSKGYFTKNGLLGILQKNTLNFYSIHKSENGITSHLEYSLNLSAYNIHKPALICESGDQTFIAENRNLWILKQGGQIEIIPKISC